MNNKKLNILDFDSFFNKKGEIELTSEMKQKELSELRDEFKEKQSKITSEKRLFIEGIVDGFNFKKLGYSLEDAKLYSETHNIKYINGFKEGFNKSSFDEILMIKENNENEVILEDELFIDFLKNNDLSDYIDDIEEFLKDKTNFFKEGFKEGFILGWDEKNWIFLNYKINKKDMPLDFFSGLKEGFNKRRSIE